LTSLKCISRGGAVERSLGTLSLSVLFSVVTVVAGLPAAASAFDLGPFRTRNESPVVQVFGLPASGDPFVLAPGKKEASVSLDVSSVYAVERTATESIVLDGETWRYGLSLRYGLLPGLEAAVELPVYQYGGGVLDSFIIGWHDTFGLPQGGRDSAPKNRLLYRYTKNGVTRFLVDDSGAGIGDLSLSAGWQLYRSEGPSPAAVALRGSVKLPTGSASRLTGSGSTDFALSVAAGKRFPVSIGETSLYGSLGGMALTSGDVLRSGQRHAVGFASVGGGWSPASWIGFKLQLDGHTPFYGDSALRELSYDSLQLVIGGTLGFSKTTSLDLGVTEDLAVNTAPDVGFHLNVRHSF
jgi:hypothetical protein